MKEAGQRVHNFEDWKRVMLELAEKATSEERSMNAAFYYRAAEFYMLKDSTEKRLMYDKFIDLFNKAFEDDEIERSEVPYQNAFLPAIRIPAIDKRERGTIVIHGGFDSLIEEFYSWMRYFSDHGHEVIAFEGPGQGAALRNTGLLWIMSGKNRQELFWIILVWMMLPGLEYQWGVGFVLEHQPMNQE